MVKPYLTTYDIMERYDVGINSARRIIRSIKEVNARGNHAKIRGALGKGKVLYSELSYWEEHVSEFNAKEAQA